MSHRRDIEPDTLGGLQISGLTCRFGDVVAVDDVDFAMRPGEFLSILGPSGCGKSTLLRSIAGLTAIAAGTIRIGARQVEAMRPAERGVAFVFQSYALYPHMTCRGNIAAPLIMAELPGIARLPGLGRLHPGGRRRRAGIAKRVAAIADQLQIADLLDRRPGQLSGGQRQRVALARALVRDPSIFLLDEPLANLDAALRVRTRTDLRALQRRLGTTTLFVTHDQAEAMAVSDRIAVMFDGRIHQIGTPDEIYRRPASLRIARFVAQPYLNVLPVETLRRLIGDATADGEIRIDGAPLAAMTGVVAFRPEDATLRAADRPGLPGLSGTVDHAEHGGAEADVFLTLEDGTRCVVRLPSAQIADWPSGRAAIVHFDLAAARRYDAPVGPIAVDDDRALA